MTFTQQCSRMACLVGVLAIGSSVPMAARQMALVKVDVGSLQAEIARQLSIDAAGVPASVYAAIHVAADVCEVSTDLLAGDIKEAGMANCTARSTSSALNQLVQRQLRD